MSQILQPRTLEKLSVVIPVFQNEGSLTGLYAELKQLNEKLLGAGTQLECIFVNDGSTDNSLSILREIKAEQETWVLVNLSRNFGAVNCSKTGLGFVSGDAFVILAADLQDPPMLLLEMCEHWRNGFDFVICERESRNDPLSTKFFAAIYYFLLRIFVIEDYPKGGYDFALMDKKLLKPMYESSKSMYTPILAWWLGFKPYVIKYSRAKRFHGKSKWTFSKKVNAALDIFLGFSKKPIRYMTYLGFLVSGTSVTFGFVILFSAVFHRISVPGYASIVALMTFLFGITILMIGIVGEYLVRIVDEVNKRPFSVISSIE